MPADYKHICNGNCPQKPSLKLKAGDLSMLYEDGSIRYISAGSNEIIRRIYSAVRDKEWLTIKPVITNVWIERHSDSFKIEYNCLYSSEDINFYARYSIVGKPDNTIIFSFEGEALSTFEKNRIGFCVLHPVEGCAGQQCLIIHSAGNSESGIFPLFIDPLQPFLDVQAMQWESNGTHFSLEFSGDIFETEDQRNWSDASYKTYCTPQSKPSPVRIEKGEKISQKIVFRAAPLSKSKIIPEQKISVKVSPGKLKSLPLTGIGRSSRQFSLTENEIRILKELRFDHYRVDLYLFLPGWTDTAEMAVKEASGLGYRLELTLFFDDRYDNQTEDLINWLSDHKHPVSVITLLHKTEPVLPSDITEKICRIIKKNLPDVLLCCGTNANFAQLNSNRPASPSCNLMCYSVHPQEHASDNTTLVENLRAQYYTVESARQFSEGKGIWISPVNIQRRFNANIENFETIYTGTSMPSQVDSRIMSLFGAGWTAGSYKYLCESGVSGVTYYETVGERGIIQGEFPPRWPDHFKSTAGMFFPVALLFKFILDNKAYRIAECSSSHPLKVECMVLSDGHFMKMLVVNFSPEPQTVKQEGLSGYAEIRQMHAGNYAEFVSNLNWVENSPAAGINLEDDLLLDPYSISFINSECDQT